MKIKSNLNLFSNLWKQSQLNMKLNYLSFISTQSASFSCINPIPAYSFNRICNKNFSSFTRNTAHSLQSTQHKKSLNLSSSSNLIFFSFFQLRTMRKKIKQQRAKNANYSQKNRKALLRRITIVGPSYNRHVIFRRVGYYHKRIKKSFNNKNKPRYKLLSMANRRFVKRNIPQLKNKKLKLRRRYK